MTHTILAAPDFPFKVLPLGEFGAEVARVDLAKVTEDQAHYLRSALAKFQLLVFRDQSLAPADQISLTRHFGNLEAGIARRPEGHQVSGFPHLLYLSNHAGSPTQEYGMGWHSDGLAYAKVPHSATMLHCLSCPPGVGDTLFADQYQAYSVLSNTFRKVIEGMYWHLPKIPYSEVPRGEGLAQPMVRTHAETGRRFIFCSPSARQIVGMTRRESAGILEVVQHVQVRSEFIYRHAWQKSDVVLWENCALLHNRADVVDFERMGLRAMHRSATSGNFEAISCPAAKDEDS
jgi:taurine dioxygenase